jgi:TRAP-type C4-dicarboxylate transport system permease large subunit
VRGRGLRADRRLGDAPRVPEVDPYFLFSNYTLAVIPLFIMMGAFAERGGLSKALFAAANAYVGHRRGGMAMAAIGACTAFGAICGSSVATTATMGRAAYPELRRFGYSDRLATGTLAVGGTLGILIPPSIILIVYAISTEQNIAKLFMAALVPGLMASAFYMLAIAWDRPPRPRRRAGRPARAAGERRRALLAVWPALLGGPRRRGRHLRRRVHPAGRAAVGAVSTFLAALARRSLGWAEIKASLLQTAELSAMIFGILLGARSSTPSWRSPGCPRPRRAGGRRGPEPLRRAGGAARVLHRARRRDGRAGDDPAHAARVLPVVTALDFGLGPGGDGIWFGILVLVIVGIGLTAPPIGLNVFVINAIVRHVPITTTYRGVLPSSRPTSSASADPDVPRAGADPGTPAGLIRGGTAGRARTPSRGLPACMLRRASELHAA